MTALIRKAWLETRARFALGAIVIVILCAFMVLVRPRMLVQWPIDKIQHPEWRDPPWWDRVHTDYAFFLWHYLYRDMLQKAFMVFAVLLGVGGLAREAASGTAGFTLALPVSRRKLLATRALVGAVEVISLGAIAAVTILAASAAIGVPYSISHAVLHSALVAIGALVARGIAVRVERGGGGACARAHRPGSRGHVQLRDGAVLRRRSGPWRGEGARLRARDVGRCGSEQLGRAVARTPRQPDHRHDGHVLRVSPERDP